MQWPEASNTPVLKLQEAMNCFDLGKSIVLIMMDQKLTMLRNNFKLGKTGYAYNLSTRGTG